jgi:CRISPR-associated protein Csh2
MEDRQTLTSRREFLFCYDFRMGNPNGDPDENRPRILPDGTYYVSDVRLKRFVRDYLKMKGHDLLVDSVEGRITNLTGRVGAYLQQIGKPEANGQELVDIILDSFIDARLFGSTLAFKAEEAKEEGMGRQNKWEPQPKTLTGATQINQGEVLHAAQEVDIRGTSIFGSSEEKRQGTFTEHFVLRYGLVGFNGIANEYSARISRLTDEDYSAMLGGLWRGIRAAGNTRTKMGQTPRLLLNLVYRPGSEFQFGTMLDYISLEPTNSKAEEEWSSPADYRISLKRLRDHLNRYSHHIERVEFCLNPDIQLSEEDKGFFNGGSNEFEVKDLDLDGPGEDGS